MIGGGAHPPIGTMCEYVVVERDEVIEVPAHLSFEQAAAWPCAGITAYRCVAPSSPLLQLCRRLFSLPCCPNTSTLPRSFDPFPCDSRAVFIKGRVAAGQNVLIVSGRRVVIGRSDTKEKENPPHSGFSLQTGIGGGVALTALQLCVAAGANVYVTSSSDEKIQKAIEQFGARGGVNYKHADWPKRLHALMKERDESDPVLDVIIDQAGGDICGKTIRMLKLGAIVVCFGM